MVGFDGSVVLDMPISHSSGSLAPLERTSVNRSISSAHYAEKESIEELEMELFGATSSERRSRVRSLVTSSQVVWVRQEVSALGAIRSSYQSSLQMPLHWSSS